MKIILKRTPLDQRSGEVFLVFSLGLKKLRFSKHTVITFTFSKIKKFKISMLTKYLGVAQFGQSPWFGTKLSKVRIFPPRPDNRTKVLPFNMYFHLKIPWFYFYLWVSRECKAYMPGYSPYSKR